jgi:uncharacterized protein (DUF2147 family)
VAAGKWTLVTKRAVLTISAALLAATAMPATASADTLFTGETQQDRKVTVRIGSNGLVNLVRIGWRTRDCKLPGYTLRETTSFRAPFDGATPDAFGDIGTYTVSDVGRKRITFRVRLSGQRVVDPANPAAESWRGTIIATATVRRRGKVVDRCSLRSIGWTALKRG